MAVQLGQVIHVPVWGATDRGDLIDSIATMHNPLKSYDLIVPARLDGYCTYCPHNEFCVGGMYHSHDSTSQSMLLYTGWPDTSCIPFCSGGDTIQIGAFTMIVSVDSIYFGQTVCPFAEGFDPANGGLLWGFADGLSQVIPIATYGCLYFSTCNAVPGDANGDGVFNAVDIVYGVNYLKGSGSPPQSWDCPGHGSVYVGADANGNCVFNGLDITYCVNYLKGRGPAPRRCPSC